MNKEKNYVLKPIEVTDEHLDNRIDKRGMLDWINGESGYAVEVLVDIFNGDYSVENFREDVLSYFQPDDRDDSWITFTDKDK